MDDAAIIAKSGELFRGSLSFNLGVKSWSYTKVLRMTPLLKRSGQKAYETWRVYQLTNPLTGI